MKFVVRVEGQEKTVFIEASNGHYNVEIDGKPVTVDCRSFGNKDFLSLLIDNESYMIESGPVKPDQGRYYARVMGRHYELDVLDELLVAVRDAESATEHTGPYTVLSPMPGRIVGVKVTVGDEVEAGSPVVIMEAMKMQNELVTHVAGVVREVLVAVGGTVDSQAPLVVIEKR
ncbi:MAG: biotin/lipoyl-containing protein [Deltaproteobacteria bacterium]|nr:biotin/lipoyl-containing protein [Deltaproteobacteria bacterium]